MNWAKRWLEENAREADSKTRNATQTYTGLENKESDYAKAVLLLSYAHSAVAQIYRTFMRAERVA